MKNIPFVLPVKTALGHYIYEVNKNEILFVDENIFQCVTSELLNKSDEAVEEQLAELKLNGYLSSHKIKHIQHSLSEISKILLDRGINQLILQVTQECNLRCKYCIYSENSNVNQRMHTNSFMTLETAKKAIDFYRIHSIDADRAVIGFYGGEPFLNFDLIKKAVEYAEIVFEGKEINNADTIIVTNIEITEKKLYEYAFQALLMAVKLGKDIICFLPLNDDEKEVIRKMCECFGGMCQFIKPLTPSHVDKDAKVQLYNFHVPVIYISEMYTNCGGYEALIRIAEAIRCKGYKPLVLSNNPYNILLKYHSINFNDVTSLENSVVEINQAVYLLSCKVNPDIIIVHLPNPVMQYNRQNRFDCGVLSHVISQAVPGNGYLYCSLKTKDFRFLKAITDTIEKKLDCPLIGVWIGNQILDPASSSGTSLVNLPADNISIQSQTDSLSIYNAYSIIDQNSLVSCIIDNFLNLSYGVI